MSDVKFVPADAYNGSPVVPTGNPMIDGVGPASWNPNRRDEPDVTYDGRPKLVAMRADPAFSIAKGDPDPRGLPVVAADKATEPGEHRRSPSPRTVRAVGPGGPSRKP